MRDKIICTDVNTEIVVRDSNGNIKKLWNDNQLGKVLKLRIPGVTGQYRDSLKNHNLITNAGIANVSALIGGIGSPSAFGYIALGTGTTAASASDAALGTEIATGGLARAAATITHTTTNVTNDSATFTHTWTATAATSVTEEGIFNASSAGTMLAHQVFSAIALNANDSITITHVVTA